MRATRVFGAGDVPIEKAESQRGPVGSSSTKSKILLAYFSRAGWNYSDGGRTYLRVGNTEVLADMISSRIACDGYRIQPVDPYPGDYDEAVERNVREQDANARPAIANPLTSVERYDILVLGSPIWNVRPPMIMLTFAESHDLRGKALYPFTTYAMGGLGTTIQEYSTSCPGSTIGEGLAVRGEEVGDARAVVESWLRPSASSKDDTPPTLVGEHR